MFDGGGLYLEVLPSGKKLWRLKYYYQKKEKRISLGSYPLISLAKAREERDEAKRLLLQDLDPSAVRKETKRQLALEAENSFKTVALEWHDIQKDRWSKNYAYKIMRGLELNLFPYIGEKPIDDISPPELLSVIRNIEKRGSMDIAGRTKQIAGQIFRYGIQTGRCERDMAADLKGALRSHKATHFRTIDIKELPAFLDALRRNEARLFERTRRAVWLSLYTFCRPVEIRKARWSDIDLDEKLWVIPAALMKMRREHIVPLSTPVIQILREQHGEVKYLNSDWVFPSQVKPTNPMSDGTVNKAIKALGFGQKMVAHGFRALARTTIHEKLNYAPEVIEKQLAHKSPGPLGEAYDRTQFLEQRVQMMQDWADYLVALSNE